MSESWYLVCTDHQPALLSDEVAEKPYQLDDIRRLFPKRAELVATMTAVGELDLMWWDLFADSRHEREAVRFFLEHPTCRLAAQTSHGSYLELDRPATEETP